MILLDAQIKSEVIINQLNMSFLENADNGRITEGEFRQSLKPNAGKSSVLNVLGEERGNRHRYCRNNKRYVKKNLFRFSKGFR